MLEDELARRTFDESGNYYVNPFKALVKSHTSDATKLTVGVEPSKAYVRGYEIQTLATTNVHFNKARTTEKVTDKVTEINHNNFIEVTHLVGTPDITTFGRFDIENAGGIYEDLPAVVDKNIVTTAHYKDLGPWMKAALELLKNQS